MNVQVIPYKKLTEYQIDRINELTQKMTLYDQIWYLAILSEASFAAFIYGDYQTILMVPYKVKWGIRYATLPNFIQKLNFIGTTEGQSLILDKLVDYFKFGEISFDSEIDLEFKKELFDNMRKRSNYALCLDSNYNELRKKFTKNHYRNIEKTTEVSMKLVKHSDDLIETFIKEKISKFTPDELNKIKRCIIKLTSNLEAKDYIKVIGAFENNFCVASALFLEFNNRIYYLLGSSVKSNLELTNKGLFAIFDWVIQTHSNSDKTIDFEGSDIPGIARFFKGFGARLETYSSIKWNRLPFPLNIIKK